MTSSIPAYLVTPSSGPLRGVAKDLSRAGVFLETRLDQELLVGDKMDLVFAVSSGGSNLVRLFRYPVFVMRASYWGIGLAFRDVNDSPRQVRKRTA